MTRVRAANIALAVMGGYCETLRPGAHCKRLGAGDVVLLPRPPQTRRSGTESVMAVPFTGDIFSVHESELRPCINYPALEEKTIDLLVPFLRWHMEMKSSSKGKNSEDDAFVRLSGGEMNVQLDADEGGGWNRASQSCLSLRAIRNLMSQHPEHVTTAVYKDEVSTICYLGLRDYELTACP